MYLINTFLGFAIAQLADILTRNKGSETSPVKFDFVFFLKDTWIKILFSLMLSIFLSVAIHFNWEDVTEIFGQQLKLNKLVFLAIGAVPELILQYAKKKLGFLQPKEVEGFNRKEK